MKKKIMFFAVLALSGSIAFAQRGGSCDDQCGGPGLGVGSPPQCACRAPDPGPIPDSGQPIAASLQNPELAMCINLEATGTPALDCTTRLAPVDYKTWADKMVNNANQDLTGCYNKKMVREGGFFLQADPIKCTFIVRAFFNIDCGATDPCAIAQTVAINYIVYQEHPIPKASSRPATGVMSSPPTGSTTIKAATPIAMARIRKDMGLTDKLCDAGKIVIGFDAYGNPKCDIDPKTAEIVALNTKLTALEARVNGTACDSNSPWGDWSSCTKECDTGTQRRTQTCTAITQDQDCNVLFCDGHVLIPFNGNTVNNNNCTGSTVQVGDFNALNNAYGNQCVHNQVGYTFVECFHDSATYSHNRYTLICARSR